MKLEEITSKKPDYSWLIYIVLMTWASCIAVGCQTKKKSLNLQKSEQSQSSDVKKETKDSTSDQSQGYYIYRETKSADYSEVIEESADSTKTDKQGVTTVYKPKRKQTRTGKRQADKKTEAKQQNDLKSASSLKLDSVGRSQRKDKSKIQAKEIKDNLTGKTLGISLLIVCFLAAVGYIRWQMWKRKALGL